VTLNAIALRSTGWSSVRVPNMGQLGAFLSSQMGISRLLNGPFGLSVTVGVEKLSEKPRATTRNVAKELANLGLGRGLCRGRFASR
jgi:hypothetical protein